MTAAFDELKTQFLNQLQSRQKEDTLEIAKDTAKLIRAFISIHKFTSASVLFDEVKRVSAELQEAKPVELVIGNISRRVLQFIREEYQNELKDVGGSDCREPTPSSAGPPEPPGSQNLHLGGGRLLTRDYSLGTLLDVVPPRNERLSPFGAVPCSPSSPITPPGGGDGAVKRKKKPLQWKRSKQVIESVTEMIADLENIPYQIAEQGADHIHPHEVILTLGMSDTALQLLEMAANKCPELHVVVAEGAPKYEGHQMAKRLAGSNIQTTVITDGAVFAVMARVNQVFMSCRYLLANGGVMAPCGTHTIALAAQRHGVPFVVLVGLHKLTPIFPHDPTVNLNDFGCSFSIASFDLVGDGKGLEGSEFSERPVTVVNPSYDYVPPELITLLITDQGGVTPSYVYRLLKETYAPEDAVLSESVYDFLTN